jgi:hypothetical protein
MGHRLARKRRISGAKALSFVERYGPTKEAAEKLALFEGYGLQAVHNCCVMNPALAAEGYYSSRNHPFSAASKVVP